MTLSSCSLPEEAQHLFSEHFEAREAISIVAVPGRVNLIGEHIDYHELPVLPMAIQRSIWIAFRARRDARVRVVSQSRIAHNVHKMGCALGNDWGRREFVASEQFEAGEPGEWGNYLKAAAQAVSSRWPLMRGIDAAIVSDLPAAAGLASSSALLVAVTLALLEANSILATLGELMEILPEGEQFVGTRGGAMDHAAVLAAREGSALLMHFAPLAFAPVAIPRDWCFLAAHSMTSAEKSAGVRAEYNARRTAGTHALAQLGFASYRQAGQYSAAELKSMAERATREQRLSGDEWNAFLHVTSEARRVEAAAAALQRDDIRSFGTLLLASHASLRDQLGVSSAALDELVEAAVDAGAMGARLTGAGFGGCALVLCRSRDREKLCEKLKRRFYAGRPGFDAPSHLFEVLPSAGALYDTRLTKLHSAESESSRDEERIAY